MKKLLLIPVLVFTLTSFGQKKPTNDLDKKVKEFDTYTVSALKQWEVPGAVVAVIKDGKVIYKKAYGTRELGKDAPVNTETLFSIGSTTKAMTAACIGMLVDEGKLRWDDPVIKYLPEFQLYDSYVTRDLRIRDLLIHDSGVGNADFLWSVMDISQDEILNRMRQVKPSYPLRGGFIYQNIFYIAAGKVIAKVSGQSWDVFIQERLFKPLAMTRTAVKLKAIKDDNLTKPHYKVNGQIVAIGYTKDDEVGPAGSIWSSIDDMSKWVICMLDSSKYPGGRLLKATTWAEMFKPQTLVTADQFYPTAQITKPNWTTYGLGWFQHDYKGHKMNFHTGSLSGLIAMNAQIPDQKMGYFFLGNYDHAEVRHALMYRAFDHFALGGITDWSSDFLKLYTGLHQAEEKQEAQFEARRVPNTNPSIPLPAYAGKYSDPLFGELVVTMEGSALKFTINNFETAILPHWHYDTFYGPWEKLWYGKVPAQFTLNPSGSVDKVNFGGMEFRKSK